MTAILSEFLRGAGVIARQTGKNLFASMYLLTRRNTRRYGGYIIHIGVVIVVIGLAGSAFNRNTEQELALHDKMSVGPYTLECVGFTQDSNANYNSDYALLDVIATAKSSSRWRLRSASTWPASSRRPWLRFTPFRAGIYTWSMRAPIPTPASRSSRRFSIRW